MSKATIKHNIKEKIEKNHQLLIKIDKLLKDFKISDENDREFLLVAYYEIAYSHFRAINILTEKKVYNSSYALVRSLFETLVRGAYMRNCLNEAKINKICAGKNNNIFPEMTDMVSKLDTLHNLNYFTQIKIVAWRIMNDYTHTGTNQLSRSYNSKTGEITPNFSDEEICGLLTICNELITTFTNLFCATFARSRDYGIRKEDCIAIFGEKAN